MNTNLLYAKASYMGFVNNDEWMNNSLTSFADTHTMTKDDVFAIANKCRGGGYTPVFADDSKLLPTSVVAGDAGAVVVTATPTSMPTQDSKDKHGNQNPLEQLTSNLSHNDKTLLEGIGIGLGVMVLFKILA